MSLLKKKGKIMFEIEKELQEIREKKRVIPATFDPVFKSLLTNENNRGYLEDLISYVTKILKEIISKNMVVVNNQLPIEKYNNKQMNTDILVEIEKNVVCLFVDRLVGKQEIVVKPIPEYIKKVKGLSGCTQLGDGSIALILDAAGLMEY